MWNSLYISVFQPTLVWLIFDNLFCIKTSHSITTAVAATAATTTTTTTTTITTTTITTMMTTTTSTSFAM